MQTIPLQATPNQELQVILDGQECSLAVFQRGENIYLNLYVGATPVITGAICQNLVSIVQVSQRLFTGYLFFHDTLGDTPPQWEGLGSRYLLVYAAASELSLS